MSAEASLKSWSPYAVEDLINGATSNETRFIDFASVWQEMQIEHDARGDFDGFRPSDNPWRAQVFDAGNTQVPIRHVVLALSAYGGASRRYLIFKQNPSSYSGWLVLGNIDILGGRYEGSPHQQYHRVITTSRHTWLLLRAVASGTGTYEIKEMWYEIRGPRPEKVLEYSIEGWHASGDVSDRKFSSRIISEKSEAGNLRVDVMFCVSYAANGSSRPRFSKRQRASYVWSADLETFELDESHSAATAREIQAVYSPGCLSQSEFIQYTSAELGRRLEPHAGAARIPACQGRLGPHASLRARAGWGRTHPYVPGRLQPRIPECQGRLGRHASLRASAAATAQAC